MTDVPHKPDLEASPQRPMLLFLALAGVLAAELAAVSLFFKYQIGFDCGAVAPKLYCTTASDSALRLFGVGLAALFLVLARPDVARDLIAARRTRLDPVWGCVHLAGLVLAFLPLAFFVPGAGSGALVAAALLWTLGAFMVGAGAVLCCLALRGVIPVLSSSPWTLAALFGIALISPDAARWFETLWYRPEIAQTTFALTEAVLRALGENVYVDEPKFLIGIGTFVVEVWHQCSGVEGVAMISCFLIGYMLIFRDQLRFPRVLLLLPIGIVLSFVLNVVRISVLILIGAHHSQELAIDGFHSHAGWLMFTLLSLGFATAAHRISWFRRDHITVLAAERVPAKTTRLPFFQDPTAALILPFMVFMGSALLASTFSQTPALLYPLRALSMATALVLFWHVLREIDWRPDVLAPCVGAAGGVIWIATGSAESTMDLRLSEALMTMSPGMFVIWAASRIVGTAVLVPVIEEFFFRGYILRRLDSGSWGMRIVALIVSSTLFAALHDRWLAAGLAGLVFGFLMLRRERVADAVWGHAVCNAVIAAWALRTGEWSVI